MFYVLFREHIRLRVRVQVSLLALLDKPTMASFALAMSSQERLECGSTFRKRNMKHLHSLDEGDSPSKFRVSTPALLYKVLPQSYQDGQYMYDCCRSWCCWKYIR